MYSGMSVLSFNERDIICSRNEVSFGSIENISVNLNDGAASDAEFSSSSSFFSFLFFFFFLSVLREACKVRRRRTALPMKRIWFAVRRGIKLGTRLSTKTISSQSRE